MNKIAVILAAGKSSRFASQTTKLLQKIGDQPIINRVVDAAIRAYYSPILVLGHQREEIFNVVETAYRGYSKYVIQFVQRGTGDALAMALPLLDQSGFTLVLNGDSPLLTAQLLLEFTTFYQENHLELATISAVAPNPYGYGRIVPTAEKGFIIVEEKELTSSQRDIKLINGGIYLFANAFLHKHLPLLVEEKSSGSGEVNITDLFAIGANFRLSMGHHLAPINRVAGVNNLEQYVEAQNILTKEQLR